MCKVASDLVAGKLAAVLYADDSKESTEMRALLDDAGARYERQDAAREGFRRPLLVVNGAFLDTESVKDIFTRL